MREEKRKVNGFQKKCVEGCGEIEFIHAGPQRPALQGYMWGQRDRALSANTIRDESPCLLFYGWIVCPFPQQRSNYFVGVNLQSTLKLSAIRWHGKTHIGGPISVPDRVKHW